MSGERLLLDTTYVAALHNSRDQFHQIAKSLFARVKAASQIWITEAILIEIGNALSRTNRSAADQFIQSCYGTSNFIVVLIKRGLQLYAERQDKDWGLTDCISFVVMRDNNLHDAVTADQHFQQAGFRALLSRVN